MQTILAWVLVGVMIAAAYPLAAWLLAKSSRHDGALLTAILTLGLSIGTLTLLMFWEGLIGIPFSLWGIALPYFVIMAVGGWMWQRGKPSAFSFQLSIKKSILRDVSKNDIGIVVAITLVSVAILFNAAYWPFHHDDVLGIYGRYGKLMAETGTLVPFAGRDDAFYQAYPMQIPLAYTFTFLASGWENEYLARVLPALLSVACLPAAFVLGNMIYGKKAGLIAALLLALTPTFVRWAAAGYVDLPMTFFYTLTAVFVWRLWDSSETVDAILLGIALGLTAWTKNAGLLGIPLVGLWLVFFWMVRPEISSPKPIQMRHIVLAVGVCFLIAAPWYIRNWVLAGLIVPPTAWTGQAQHTFSNLMVFVTEPQNFAITGWLIVIGVVAVVYDVTRRGKAAVGQILLLTMTLPFFAAWWWFVSYDPRFLLLFLPILTVMAGAWIARIWVDIPERGKKPAKILVAVVAVALTLYMTWISVEFKPEILRDPLMGDAAKHAIVLNKNDS